MRKLEERREERKTLRKKQKGKNGDFATTRKENTWNKNEERKKNGTVSKNITITG